MTRPEKVAVCILFILFVSLVCSTTILFFGLNEWKKHNTVPSEEQIVICSACKGTGKKVLQEINSYAPCWACGGDGRLISE